MEESQTPPEAVTTVSANWSETVEDLVEAGDAPAAISLLESLISKLDTQESDCLQLSSALTELAKIYNSQGFSLKADELLSRASVAKQRAHSQRDVDTRSQNNLVDIGSSRGHHGVPEKGNDSLPSNASSDDDWEALADRAPDEFLTSQSIPAVSRLTIDEPKSQMKRRGRGTFSYQKGELYSDRISDETTTEDAVSDDASHNQEENTDKTSSNYGTKHVLVLADFLPSTRTTDLEKHFEDFKERGFVIRWVNDTCALAVFKTPSIALEAFNRNRCPFTVRVLGEDDAMLNSLSNRDLEPPRQRPQTSTSTAQRLIAHGMGLKLPPSTFGSSDYRRREEERRNRIVTRQKLRDDAWGDDVN